jgi:molybdopterin-guanine dinucleotide biosynthesis protein A
MISCAITAGGKASRMQGKTKAFTLINDEKIIDTNLKVLRKIFNEIIIISNKTNEFIEYTELKTYSDYYKNIGPLAGLHSSIKNTKSDFIFILSSDLPFISKRIITKLMENSEKDDEAIIPRIGNNVEPLFGIYNSNIQNKLERYIESKKSRSMKSFLKTLKVKYIELEDNEENRRAFTNINSEKDKRLT